MKRYLFNVLLCVPAAVLCEAGCLAFLLSFSGAPINLPGSRSQRLLLHGAALLPVTQVPGNDNHEEGEEGHLGIMCAKPTHLRRRGECVAPDCWVCSVTPFDLSLTD